MLPYMTFRALKVSICSVTGHTAFQKARGPGFRTKRPPFSETFQIRTNEHKLQSGCKTNTKEKPNGTL